MKKIITLITTAAVIGLATPAVAQSGWGNNNNNNRNSSAYGYAQGNGGIEARTEQLQRRIQVGIQRGTISRQEAVFLRDQFRQLNRLERQYSRNGLNRDERRSLQQRIQYLQQQVQAAERNRDNRYDRDDNRDWRDGRDDRNDGDRRWDDDNRGRDDDRRGRDD